MPEKQKHQLILSNFAVALEKIQSLNKGNEAFFFRIIDSSGRWKYYSENWNKVLEKADVPQDEESWLTRCNAEGTGNTFPRSFRAKVFPRSPEVNEVGWRVAESNLHLVMTVNTAQIQKAVQNEQAESVRNWAIHSLWEGALRGGAIAMMLDADFHIERFTPNAQEYFNISSTKKRHKLTEYVHLFSANDGIHLTQLGDLTQHSEVKAVSGGVVRYLQVNVVHVQNFQYSSKRASALNFILFTDITETFQSRETLAHQAELLRSFFATTNDLLLEVKEDGEVLFANPQWEELFPYCQKGDSLSKIANLDIAAYLAKRQESQELNFSVRDPNTNKPHFLVGKALCLENKDASYTLRLALRDVTALLRAERQQEAMQKIMEESSKVLSPDKLLKGFLPCLRGALQIGGIFLRIHHKREVEEYTYYSETNYADATRCNSLDAVLRVQPQPEVATYILIEESRLLPLDTEVVEGVILLPVKQKNGEQWEATLMLEIERGDFPFEYDEKVKELCVFVVQQLSLVLQQYMNRNQRIKLGNYMSNLLSQGQMLFAILNKEGYVIDASNSFKVLQKGYSRKGEYHSQMHISELTFYEDEWDSALNQALRGGSSRQNVFFTLTYRHRAYRKFQLTFTPVRHNDISSTESQEVILFAHDITSQDKAQREMQQTLEQRQQILSHMSHEIRTPLNGVIGMLDVLGNTSLQKQQQDYLDDIRNSAHLLMELVNDILDYSKIEAGKLPIRLSPTDLYSLCFQTQKLFAAKAGAAKTKLVVDYDESLPHFFELDYIRVSQVLTNLTSNAVKFTENGSVTIRIRPCPRSRYPRRLSNGEHCLYIAVEDTGIGIPPHKQKELFQVFSQIHHSYNNVKGGTGLGLAISKSLVELMGGQIGIEEARTKGATFWFTLPLKEVSSEEVVTQKSISTKDAVVQKLKGLRVLLVDDNATNRQVGKILLTQLEAEVTLAKSGAEAIKHLEQQGSDYFHVILMDIQMPGLDGIETTKLLRKEYSNLPKIFALTAFALPEERDNILKEGLDGHVGKPITTETLQKALSPLCNQVSPLQENASPSKTKEASTVLGEGFSQLLQYMSSEETKELMAEAKLEVHQLLGVLTQEEFLPEESMHAAHTLKGALAQIGGDTPAASAELLEQYFRGNEDTTEEVPKELINRLLEETQQFFEAVQDALA